MALILSLSKDEDHARPRLSTSARRDRDDNIGGEFDYVELDIVIVSTGRLTNARRTGHALADADWHFALLHEREVRQEPADLVAWLLSEAQPSSDAAASGPSRA